MVGWRHILGVPWLLMSERKTARDFAHALLARVPDLSDSHNHPGSPATYRGPWWLCDDLERSVVFRDTEIEVPEKIRGSFHIRP